MTSALRLLVTGGSGFIGRHLAPRLQAEGHRVTLFDLQPPRWDTGGAAVLLGDVRDPAAVARAVSHADAVFHLAAAHHDSGIAEETYFGVNQRGTEVVCRAMEEAGVQDIVFLSSVAALGDVPRPRLEGVTPRPVSPYGRSKLAAEVFLRSWAEALPGRHALVLRPVVVFGPHNFGNMYTLIRHIARGWYVQLGEGTNLKSLLYVDNLVEAVLRVWAGPRRFPFELYHVVDKPDLASSEIAKILARALGRSSVTLRVPVSLAVALTWPFESAARFAGLEFPMTGARIRKFASLDSAYESQHIDTATYPGHVPLEEGLARMAAWFSNGGAVEPPVIQRPPRDVYRGEAAA